jgi:hypothetical protein
VLPLPCLLVWAALAPALGASPIRVPSWGSSIPLEVALDIRTEGHPAPVPALIWRGRDDGTLEGVAATSEWEAKVEVAPVPGGARAIEIAIRWLAPAEVERAAVQLGWAGAAPRAVGRTLRFEPLAGPLRVERGTPLLVAAGQLVLAGGPGLAAARVEPERGGVRAVLLLDDAAARPFSTYESCLDHLPGEGDGQPALSWGALERRRPLTFAPRAAGDVDRASAVLYPLADGAPFLPVVVERWPAGARAAIVFTDHADRTDPDALRAVLWGDSDPRAEGAVGAGFLGRGLKITRTFFVHAKRGGLDDPQIRSIADALALAGSEVGLHSITGERDGREEVRAGIAAAAPWRPVTWIDHQPYTNCEALSSEGWRAGGKFGIRDILAESGIRWVWAAGDFGPGAARIVDLLGGRPDEARAAIYPFPLDPRLWIFRSSMFFAPPAALAAALSDDALARLEADRGLFVAHTYLGPAARTTHSADHLGRLVVREAPGGRLVLDPALDAALARIAARVHAGRLASLAWAEAGDRLRALGEVEVVYRPDGAAEIRNRGPFPIDGLTVAIPAPPGLDLALEGALLLGREDDEVRARIWFDLPAGGRVVLRAMDRFLPVPLLPSS